MRATVQVVVSLEAKNCFLCETLRPALGDLCGFALFFMFYRKVRKGFRKDRKAN
jgi:hypothetical protein